MQYLFPVLQWKLFIVCSSQVTDKEREFAAGVLKQLEYQQFEDDKLSQKSFNSKLSRSPLKIVKKPKSMQCKVILLDGSEYTCDVEVSVYFKTFLSQILRAGECCHRTCKMLLYFFRTLENYSGPVSKYKIICKVSNRIKLLKILILSPKCYHQKKNMIFKKKKSATLSMVGKKIGGLKNQIFINILAMNYHLNEFLF